MRQHDLQLKAYRDQRATTSEMHPGQAVNPSEPLRMIMAGTAGTGKTVVINEMVRTVGAEKLNYSRQQETLPVGSGDRYDPHSKLATLTLVSLTATMF